MAMLPYEERARHAAARYAQGMQRVQTTPEPEGQKFPRGSTVKIADDLGPLMSHFPGAGRTAKVLYVHAHAYGGEAVGEYCLDVAGIGKVAWYGEKQLEAV